MYTINSFLNSSAQGQRYGSTGSYNNRVTGNTSSGGKNSQSWGGTTFSGGSSLPQIFNLVQQLLEQFNYHSNGNKGSSGNKNGNSYDNGNNSHNNTENSSNGSHGNNGQNNTCTGSDKTNQYRTYDGTANNRKNSTWGSTEQPQLRLTPQDTTREPGGTTEASLPSPREVSNAVSTQTGNTANSKGLSDMFWLWGQFLDHDITLVETDSSQSANIAIPQGDAYFDPQGTGTATMPFSRSVSVTDANGQSQQVNSITAFIDGSNIYGSNETTANNLRSHEGGQMIMSENNLMPEDTSGQYMSGDVRANENPGLTSMHTLWVREHNRIAEELATQHPGWDDEKLYQEARKINVAQMQAITYNEFLPALLGEDAIPKYTGYKSDVNPSISNEFAGAIYRLGHTMLSSNLLRLDENGQEIPEGSLALRDAFFQPQVIAETGIDSLLRGFAAQTAQAVDPMIVDDVRNFLFGEPGAGGFDLAALNIQRGRDHGLPGYNDAREALGLSRIESFDDPIWRDGVGEKLAQVYDSPDDVDLWVAGLAEKETGNSLVGELSTNILVDQFTRLRDGDRFWYESQFSGKQLQELNNLKLSDVIKRNTDIENIQTNVMVASNVHLGGEIIQEQSPAESLPPVGRFRQSYNLPSAPSMSPFLKNFMQGKSFLTPQQMQQQIQDLMKSIRWGHFG